MLTVDAEREEVRSLEWSARGKWVVFWAVVALAGEHGAADTEVHAYEPWSNGRLASVGKEVWRHLQRPPVGNLLSPGERCRHWTLAQHAQFTPSREAVVRWLGARRTRSQPAPLAALALAHLDLLRGHSEAARVVLSTAVSPTDTWTEAARAWLRGRLAAREEDMEALQQLLEAHHEGVAGRALRDRLTLADAMLHRADDAPRARAAVARVAGRAGARGDLATLASAVNVGGVLDRRAGDHRRARDAFSRATSMALLTGDVYLLQGALFNLSLAHGSLGESRLADEHLAAALTIADSLGVGHDTCQAEAVAAERALTRGDEAAAWQWVLAALKIVTRLDADWEQALFHQARGRVCRRWPRDGIDAERDLATAERLFRLCGDEANALRVAALRARR